MGLASRGKPPDSRSGGWGSGMNSLTAVSDVDQRGARILARSGRSDGKRAFRAAVRHSRHVRLLRIAVPLSVAVLLVGGVAFTALVKPLRVLSSANVDVGSLVVSGTKIMMQQPRLAGFTRDNRRYNMIAQAAAQDLTKPDVVERLQSLSERGGDRRSGQQNQVREAGGGEDGDLDDQCQWNGGRRVRRCHALRPRRIRYPPAGRQGPPHHQRRAQAMSAGRLAGWRWLVALAIAVGLAAYGSDAGAQQKTQGPPNALQGFSQNRDEPVKIRAASLEVREKDKQATFAGDVHVLQGDTEMRCKLLTVFR